jgi:trans-aconitate methyltransferase
VLDLGCGNGEFTTQLAELISGGRVVGIDASEDLLSHARGLENRGVTFRKVDLQRLAAAFPADEQFDVIVSRAALHWLPDTEHPRLLESIHGLISADGWVQLEFGGAGNIPRMHELLTEVSQTHGGTSQPWFFPDAGQYLELCETAGLVGDIKTVAQRRTFSREGIVGWMRSQGFQAFEASLGDRYGEFMAEAEQRLDEVRRVDGSYDLTYVRLVATLRSAR